MNNSIPTKTSAVAYATLPPPVTGLSHATQCFLDATSDSIDWTIHSVGKASSNRSSGQLDRLLKNAIAIAGCALRRRSTISRCYMPVSAGVTMAYSIGYATACAVRNIPLAVHHHSYAYINQHSRSMATLNSLMTTKDLHIFLSDRMRDAFDGRYSRSAQAVTLPNSYTLDSISRHLNPRSNTNNAYRIGHLSNLTIAKGLQTVIEAFAELKRRGCRCELHLAGPVAGDHETRVIENAKVRFGHAIKIYGAVYGSAKNEFFSNIDSFWFPTEYVNEAQPIVLLEAMSFGVPCIAINRGCIEWLLGDAGKALNGPQEFLEVAVQQAQYQSLSTDYLSHRTKCLQRLTAIRVIEQVGITQVINFLINGTAK